MKQVFKLLAMGCLLLFWFGVLASLIAPLPGKLNGFLPVCGAIVILMHWAQAAMLKASCKPYFIMTRREFIQIMLFGVFGMADIRARLQAIVDERKKNVESAG